MKHSKTQTIAILGALVAIEVILNRFLSINAWNIKIGLSFLPIALAALLYGAIPAGIVAGLGDFVGAILFPIGQYFPGFTATAFLMGVVLGLFLYRKTGVPRVVCAVLINQLILGLLVNTFWISLLYGSPYAALLPTRAIQALILSVVQIVGILVLQRVSSRFIFAALAQPRA